VSEAQASTKHNTAVPQTDQLMRIGLFFLIALSPIQDLFLQATPLKGLGASASLIPMLAIVSLVFARWLMEGTFRVSWVVIICAAYAFGVSVYGFLYFGFKSQSENLFLKSVTALITLGLFLAAIFIPKYDFRRTVRAACYVAFAILILGVLFSRPTPFGLPELFDNSILHNTPATEFPRPRGLSTEPSTFSVTAIAICLLCAHQSRKGFSRLFFLLASLGLLVASGSKGGILILFVCIFVLAVTKWHRWYQVPLLALTVLPLGFAAVWWLPSLFPEQGALQLGSVQTRASVVLCALDTVQHHPFGVGFSGFLPAVAAYLPNAMSTVQAQSPLPLDFSEAFEYLNSSQDVSTKTFFFDQLMRFGVPFAIIFIFSITKLLKRIGPSRQQILFVAVLACAIALSTYVTLTGQYATSILLGVALAENSALQPVDHYKDMLRT
jgi:hypothetical protein